jgi:hypothetical protein
MPKFTRHIKKNRNNISLKNRYPTHFDVDKKGGYIKREGIIDAAENTAYKALNTVGDIGLRMFGLERINKDDSNEYVEHNQPVQNTENIIEQTSKNILGNVNKVLDSEIVDNTVKETAKDTAQIVGKLSSRFNEAMDDPIIKENIEKSIKNAGELSNVVVESFKEPFNRGVNNLIETANEAAPKLGKAITKTAWDTVTAIPPISIVGDLINITNGITKAASAATDAGTQAIVSASDTFIETKDNMQKILKNLDVQKQMAQQISNRTTSAINNFENPLTPIKTGGIKSRRRLFKRKAKSKRVKFAS